MAAASRDDEGVLWFHFCSWKSLYMSIYCLASDWSLTRDHQLSGPVDQVHIEVRWPYGSLEWPSCCPLLPEWMMRTGNTADKFCILHDMTGTLRLHSGSCLATEPSLLCLQLHCSLLEPQTMYAVISLQLKWKSCHPLLDISTHWFSSRFPVVRM